MIISLIAAMAENRVIGYKKAIPWKIPSDQKRFRSITMGHAILFGRVTYEIIGRPLPGRKNIVLTTRKNYHAPGAIVVHNLDEALGVCAGEEELFIGGGGIVFDETVELAERIYLSVIHRVYRGDSFFPVIPDSFREVSREEIKDILPYSFIQYERLCRGRLEAGISGGFEKWSRFSSKRLSSILTSYLTRKNEWSKIFICRNLKYHRVSSLPATSPRRSISFQKAF
jgi:dihydrofolate reductase